MSRIGRKKIPLPSGVQVRLENREVVVEGPKGRLKKEFSPQVAVVVEQGGVVVSRSSEDRGVRALHGLARSMIANMIIGVTRGYEKFLEINGVGYRALVEGRDLLLHIGCSHPVVYPLPQGIDAHVEKQTMVTIRGVDKALVGQVAADIRAMKEPDPYKGKGIKYRDERIVRKEGKRGK